MCRAFCWAGDDTTMNARNDAAGQCLVLPLDQLHLDPENPRLPKGMRTADESAILQWMLVNGCLPPGLMESIAGSDYCYAEPLLVVPAQDSYVAVEGNRIKLRLYRKNETGGYDFYGEDTVVSTEAPTGVPSSIFTENDPDKKKVYYVSLDNEIRTTRSLKVRAPEQISYERSAVVELDSDREAGISFLSYANGRLVMRADRLSDAIDSCYEEMGHVTDQNGRIVYNRADRTESMTIANPMQTAYPLIVALESFSGNMDYEDESLLVLDAYGLDLTKLLYFVYKGMPVAVSLPDGSYAYLYGYNNDQIRIYMPASGDESVRELSMSRDEAEQWLFSMDYNTICAVAY